MEELKPKVIHVLLAGSFYKIVDPNGKTWTFEMHRYCGPIAVKKDGEPRKKQLGAESIFWRIVTNWVQQGQKVNKDNYCEYELIPDEPWD